MDLAAFLAPGLHPVFLHRAGGRRAGWGHVLSRPDRRACFLAAREPACGPLTLALNVPGFRLLEDGSLRPAPGENAPVRLAAEVSAARPWPGKALFVLRFRRLVRILD
jgi:hypothetical protein